MPAFNMDTEHTMLEVAKMLGIGGNLMTVVDVLSAKNPFMEEGYWKMADDFNSEHLLQSLTEPTGADIRINKGVPWETSTTKPVTEPLQGIRSINKIDRELLKKQMDAGAYREAKNKSHLRGMVKTLHSRVLYGNRSLYPDQIDGFMNRFNSLSLANVFDGGGANDGYLTSILVVKWGEEATYFAYPRGGDNFIEELDLGQFTILDADDNPLVVVGTQFEISFGLCVADDRKVYRVANVSTALSDTFDENILIQALNQVRDGLDNTVIYVDRNTKTRMDIRAKDKANVLYGVENIWGVPTTTFQQVPVRLCEAILDTEDLVS